MKIRLAFAIALATGTALTATAAQGEPPAGSVRPHQHFLERPDGTRVPIGPESCTAGPSRQFDNFHLNVHAGPPGDKGVVVSQPCPAAP